jgi:hypothetical protein
MKKIKSLEKKIILMKKKNNYLFLFLLHIFDKENAKSLAVSLNVLQHTPINLENKR